MHFIILVTLVLWSLSINDNHVLYYARLNNFFSLLSLLKLSYSLVPSNNKLFPTYEELIFK